MKELTIGRSSEADIVINDNYVSRKWHAIFIIDGDTCYIRDENSSTGTYINGNKIPPKENRRLNPSDVVKVGNTVLKWKNYLNAPPAEPIAPRIKTKTDAEEVSLPPVPETRTVSKPGHSSIFWPVTIILLLLASLLTYFIVKTSDPESNIAGDWVIQDPTTAVIGLSLNKENGTRKMSYKKLLPFSTRDTAIEGNWSISTRDETISFTPGLGLLDSPATDPPKPETYKYSMHKNFLTLTGAEKNILLEFVRSR